MDIKQAQGGYDFDIDNSMGIPESDLREIQQQTRIGVLQARVKSL